MIIGHIGKILIKIPSYIYIAASSWVSKATSMALQLICISYFINKLGNQSYSIFALLAALLIWANLSDLGLGYSLQNYISERNARNKKNQKLITGTYLILFPIYLTAALLILAIAPYLSKEYLRLGADISESNRSSLFLLTAIIFLVTSVGAIPYKIMYAMHRGWVANLLIALGAIIGSIFALNFDIKSGNYDEILKVTILYYGPSALISVTCFIYIYCINYIKINFKIFKIIFKKILSRGISFWIFAVISTLVLQADYLVISQKLNAEEVTIYTTVMKIFGLLIFVYAALLQAIWPKFVELRIKSEFDCIRSMIYKYIKFGFMISVLFTILLYLNKDNILKLFKIDIIYYKTTIFLLFIYSIIRIWTDTFAMVLQSGNAITPLLILAPIQALIGLILQWNLVKYYGINGIIFGLIGSYFLTVSIGLPIIYFRKLNKS